MDTVTHGCHFETTEDDYGVRWGRLTAEEPERFKFYDSFHLDGEEFFVKDTVYLQASNGPPYIAQIGKLRENVGTGRKTMLVNWFFRACELPKGLPAVDYSENSKEIFMAVGSVTNKLQNPACTLKHCRVLCVAKESWNSMPSDQQIAAADHVFDRAFDPEKLRLQRLEPLKETCGEYINLRISKKELKAGKTSRSGQAVSKDVDMLNRNPGLQSKMVIIGKPPKQYPPRDTDHADKFKLFQKHSPADTLTQGKAFQRLESRKRPRGDTSEEQILRGPALDDMKSGKERSAKFSGEQDLTRTEKRRKIGDYKTGNAEVNKARLVTSREEIDKRKMNGQPGNVCALPLGRPYKAPVLDGKRSYERNPEGSIPCTSSKSGGKQGSVTRDGEGIRLGKRTRDGVLPSGKVKKKLVDHSKPNTRVEGHLECALVRRNVSHSQKAGFHLSEHKRSEDIISDSVKEKRNGVDPTSAKILRKFKSGIRESEDAHKHSSSASVHQHAQKAKSAGGRLLGEHVTRPVVTGDKVRVTAEGGGIRKGKQNPDAQGPIEIPQRPPDRCAKGADFECAAQGFGSAIDHGRALSTEGHYKLYMPWDEKKSVEEAITKGRALILKNLDPCLNSIEIEALLENVLDTTCDVRILPPKAITCYKSAEAIVIFKKAEIAHDVLRILIENLLVISEDERPVLASLLMKSKQSINNFHGFFNLEKFGRKMNESADQKNAVATSHCAQTNTVEYDMGLHWRVLQERGTLEWQRLEEDHQRELVELRAKYQKYKL